MSRLREWVRDEDVRARAETMALSACMLGVGAGVATMWCYALLAQAAPLPPEWLTDVAAQYRAMIWIATGVLGAGGVVMAVLFAFDADASSSDDATSDGDAEAARTDGGTVEDPSPGQDATGSGGETTLRDRLGDTE